MTFDVCSQSGKKNSRHTVRVIARDQGVGNYPIKRTTFDGKDTFFYEISKKKSGKFNVIMNKGYKLKSVTMTYYDKTGTEVTKKIKNNSKVTLSEYARKHENEWTSSYSDDWVFFIPKAEKLRSVINLQMIYNALHAGAECSE